MTNNKKSTYEGMDPIIRDVVRGDFERKIQDLISNGRSARTVAARLVESMPMSAIRLIGAEHLQSAMAIDRGASSVDADPVNPADIAELRRTFRDRLIAGFPAGVHPT
jgi:phage tail tape-measure protein